MRRQVFHHRTAFSFVALLLISRGVAAQSAGDVRWQPWYGCWEAIDRDSSDTFQANARPRVCVVPAAGTSAADVVILANDSIVMRRHIEGSGAQRDVTAEGCTGWERAHWSPDGQRLYLRSSATCPGGFVRGTNGVFAISSEGEWIEVESVTSGAAVGVRATRYRDVTGMTPMPSEIQSALANRPRGGGLARIAAAAPLTIDNVIEAAKALDAGVLETLLYERGEGFALDAEGLRVLDRAQVPPTVIDVMVALTYPESFMVDPSGEIEPAAEVTRAPRRTIYGGEMYDPWLSGMYGYPYGYGYGYGYGYSRWRYGPSVIVVSRPSPNDDPDSHGRVTKDRGYTAPRGTTRAPATSSGATKSSGGSSKGSVSAKTGGSSNKAGSGSKASTRGSSGRTAKPRKP